MKPWFLSKTIWFNLASIIILVIQYFIDNQMFPDYVKWEILAIAVINMILRLIMSETLQPLGKTSLAAYKASKTK